jgi:hypothetical protein
LACFCLSHIHITQAKSAKAHQIEYSENSDVEFAGGRWYLSRSGGRYRGGPRPYGKGRVRGREQMYRRRSAWVDHVFGLTLILLGLACVLNLARVVYNRVQRNRAREPYCVVCGRPATRMGGSYTIVSQDPRHKTGQPSRTGAPKPAWLCADCPAPAPKEFRSRFALVRGAYSYVPESEDQGDPCWSMAGGVVGWAFLIMGLKTEYRLMR